MFSEKFGWQPIDTAPINKDVMLIVTDGHGEPYAVFKPFRLTAAGWVSSEKGTPLAVTPVRVEAAPCRFVETMTSRRFPAPWRADKITGGYVARDANGEALA